MMKTEVVAPRPTNMSTNEYNVDRSKSPGYVTLEKISVSPTQPLPPSKTQVARQMLWGQQKNEIPLAPLPPKHRERKSTGNQSQQKAPHSYSFLSSLGSDSSLFSPGKETSQTKDCSTQSTRKNEVVQVLQCQSSSPRITDQPERGASLVSSFNSSTQDAAFGSFCLSSSTLMHDGKLCGTNKSIRRESFPFSRSVDSLQYSSSLLESLASFDVEKESEEKEQTTRNAAPIHHGVTGPRSQKAVVRRSTSYESILRCIFAQQRYASVASDLTDESNFFGEFYVDEDAAPSMTPL